METLTQPLTLADKLRMARARAELSLDQMAHSISTVTGHDISRETVRRWEKAKSSPDIATLEAVAHVSGLNYGWLVGVSPNCVDPGSPNGGIVNHLEARVNSMSDEELALARFAPRKSRAIFSRAVGHISRDEVYIDLRERIPA